VNIKCVVTCRDANGTPTFFPCVVDCGQEEYDNGEHYECARAMAEDHRYEDPGLVFDENDGPAWLFEKLFPGWPASKEAS
jgi:hypothetical protein